MEFEEVKEKYIQKMKELHFEQDRIDNLAKDVKIKLFIKKFGDNALEHLINALIKMGNVDERLIQAGANKDYVLKDEIYNKELEKIQKEKGSLAKAKYE
ncbi:MAG: hypothetical protein EAX96_21195 [Candidatus Lokiarchaeota archaeon]|nr:hypothetical protein [Candidatus Lokiarchaeota archaeon]